MSFISKSIRYVFTSVIIRKVVHIVFSLMLLLLFAQAYRELILFLWPQNPDPTLTSLTILLFSAAVINSLQIRLPDLRERFLKVSGDARTKIIEFIEASTKGKPYAEIFESILRSIAKYEERFLEFLSFIERDYELRYGYICITFGLLSVTMSYVLFGYRAVYGILALAIVDSVSAIVTFCTPRRRKRLKHSDISIAITFSVFTPIVYIFAQDIVVSLVLGIVAVVVELLSPEDNLTLPIATSFTAYILNARVPMI